MTGNLEPRMFYMAVAGEGSIPTSCFGLTPELAEKARGRIRQLAAFMACLNVFGILLSTFFMITGELSASAAPTQYIIYLIGLIFSFILWFIARSERFSHALVLNLGLVFEVVIYFGAAWEQHSGTSISLAAICRL